MSPGPPKIGVWRASAGLLDLRFKQILWPEGLPAVVVGGGGAVLIVRGSSVAERADAMSGILQLNITLLAIVFTALAIVVALPTGSYLRALQKDDPTSDGMIRFLNPFLFAVGVQVLLILYVIAFGLVSAAVSPTVEHLAFYVLGFLLVYGLLDVAGLARSLVKHGVYRAIDAVNEHDANSNVSPMPDRRTRGGDG